MNIVQCGRRVGAVISVLLLCATMADAGACRFGVCFGAVAAGPGGAAARVANRPTAQLAFEAALKQCRGKCEMVEVFHSGCGTLVQGGRDEIFAGFGVSEEDAFAEAQAHCLASGHRLCVARARACTRM